MTHIMTHNMTHNRQIFGGSISDKVQTEDDSGESVDGSDVVNNVALCNLFFLDSYLDTDCNHVTHHIT